MWTEIKSRIEDGNIIKDILLQEYYVEDDERRRQEKREGEKPVFSYMDHSRVGL